MSTTLTGPSHRVDGLHPGVAASVGAAVFTLAITSGIVFDLNADPPDAPALVLREYLVYAGMVLTAVVIAAWVGTWARAGSPRRLSGTALGLAVSSAGSFVVFWSSWPLVFGAVAVALALEHRRRVGSFSGTAIAALALGTLGFAASAALCLLG